MGTESSGAKPYPAVRRASPFPLYWQIEQDLRGRIASREFRPNDQLPSEAELSELFGVSRITVRQALSNLTAEGILVRKRGLGTFVSERLRARAVRRLRSLSSDMMRYATHLETIVIECTIRPADSFIAPRFGQELGAPNHELTLLHKSDGTPFAVQIATLPVDRFSDLAQANLTGSLYGVLLERYGVEPTEADEIVRASTLESAEQIAELLKVPAGASVFVMERLSLDELGPVDFLRSYVRADRYQINNSGIHYRDD